MITFIPTCKLFLPPKGDIQRPQSVTSSAQSQRSPDDAESCLTGLGWFLTAQGQDICSSHIHCAEVVGKSVTAVKALILKREERETLRNQWSLEIYKIPCSSSGEAFLVSPLAARWFSSRAAVPPSIVLHGDISVYPPWKLYSFQSSLPICGDLGA